MKLINSVVYPLVTPFKKNGEVDSLSISRYVNFLISGGAKMIITTVGTSRFNLLQNEEIIKVNNKLVESVNRKAFTVCAGPIFGSTNDNLKILKEVKKDGGNSYLAIYPERFYEENSIIKYFYKLADSSDIPIFIHQMSLRSGYGGNVSYSKALISKLMSHENILGMKEESLDKNLSNWIHKNFSHKKIIIGQGGMLNFIKDSEHGARSYLAGIGSFIPQIEEKFHEYILNNRLNEAIEIKKNFEDPYFNFAVSLGWHVQLKEILSFKKLMNNYERLPLEPLSKKNSLKLKKFFENSKSINLEVEIS